MRRASLPGFPRATSLGARLLARATSALVAVALAFGVCAGAAHADEAAAYEDVAERVGALVAEQGTDAEVVVLVTSEGSTVVERYYDDGVAEGSQDAVSDAGSDDGGSQGEGSSDEAAQDDEGLLSDGVFSWGHASDLLVWVSVMQLVESGDLGLDDAILSLLPESVSLPDGYESITMLDLMNHTTGLDASPISDAVLPDEGASSIEALLACFDVEAYFEVGELVAYSPYDVALAAAVVESVSGMAICDYVEEHVFEPLGMDETVVLAGARPHQMASSGDEAVRAVAERLVESPDASQASLVSVSDRPALTCIGSPSDLLAFERALLDSSSGLFADPETADLLFEVTRTYPSSGDERIAHGLFAFPFSTGTYGVEGTSSGYSVAAYVSPQTGVGVVVLVNRSSGLALAHEIVRLVMGGEIGEAVEATEGETSVWQGVYQDASLPAHGPLKILSAARRLIVLSSVDDDGSAVLDVLSLSSGFSTLASRGDGTYADVGDESSGETVYRFCVGLTVGNEASSVTSDLYLIPSYLLAVEGALLLGGMLGLVVCLGYALAGALSLARAFALRRRMNAQPAVLALSLVTSVVMIWILAILVGPGAERVLLSLTVTRALGVSYMVVAAALLVWLGVTRWRGLNRQPRRLAASVLVGASALVLILNFVYWEILA